MSSSLNNPILLYSQTGLTADVTTGAIKRANLARLDVQCNFGGSPVGKLYLQVSLDGVNWVNVEGSELDVGAAGPQTYSVPFPTSYQYRIFFDRTSGTFDLDIFYHVSGAQ